MKKCLVVLSGWAKKNKKGVWKTSGPSGVKLRVTAAKCLWDKDRDLFIIASGKKGDLINIIDRPLAEIIAQELVGLGVCKEKIIKEPNSDNTYEHLVNLPSLIKKYKFGNILIISNEWHLARIKTMIEFMTPDLKNLLSNNKIKLVSAENILIKDDPKRWKPKIHKIRASNAFAVRIKRENRGIQDIINSRYKSTH